MRILSLLSRPAWLAGTAAVTVLAVAGAVFWLYWADRPGTRPHGESAMLAQARKVSLANVRKTTAVGPHFVRRIDADLSTLSPAARKRHFLQAVLPLVARENDRIRAERNMLAKTPNALPDSLYERYEVKPGDLKTLRHRVDIVPASLAIAQAAIESGWGTSRFALDGNNLFGMRTYRDDTPGIQPAAAKGFKLIRFKSLSHSVDAYMRNLNTNPAYVKFREARAALRRAGKQPSGLGLTGVLDKYSEIPHEYALRLRKLIRREKLTGFDHVRVEADK